MKNYDLNIELNNFTDTISDFIYDAILEKKYLSLDKSLLKELKTRVDFVNKTEIYIKNFLLPENYFQNDEIEDFVVTFAVIDNKTFTMSADNCPLDGSPVGLHINIFIPSHFDPRKDAIKDILMSEIENSVRHEIEHFVQDEFPDYLDYLDYHKIYFRSSKNSSNISLYLMQPSEVAAHVRGYEKNSKNHFEFYKSIINLLEGYVRQSIMSEEDLSNVFLCWKDWFVRNTYLKDEGSNHE
jgi:hypothetical protein